MSERSLSKLSLHRIVQSPYTPAPLSDEWRHCQTSKQFHELVQMRNITRKTVIHLRLNEVSDDLFER